MHNVCMQNIKVDDYSYISNDEFRAFSNKLGIFQHIHIRHFMFLNELYLRIQSLDPSLLYIKISHVCIIHVCKTFKPMVIHTEVTIAIFNEFQKFSHFSLYFYHSRFKQVLSTNVIFQYIFIVHFFKQVLPANSVIPPLINGIF